jgi:hypothetical protein
MAPTIIVRRTWGELEVEARRGGDLLKESDTGTENRALARCVYLFGSGRIPDALLLALSGAEGRAAMACAANEISLETVEDAHPA